MRLPDGRANFAEDEAKFLISHAKPETMWDKAKLSRIEKKKEKYDILNRELESLTKLIDNPEMAYDEKVH
jgi:hypothetical protein